jgi:hypothetical protein
MSLKERLENFRRWIDSDVKQTVTPEQPERRSSEDDFFLALAREVEADLRREMFTPPGGPVYLPGEYLIFLSQEDDARWRGPKREGLERGLQRLLSERAKELAGAAEFTVKLRVDGTLEPGRFRAQPVWDQREETVLARRRRDEEETLAREFAIAVRRSAANTRRWPNTMTEDSPSPASENPITLADGRQLTSGQSGEVRPGEKIIVGGYELVVR